MSFEVPAEAYDAFMGPYAEPLADLMTALAGIGPRDRVLDVGCGPGALTARLVDRAASVAAVDPSEPFLAAVARRCPTADVRRAVAADLPFADSSFDVAVAQLVVHFLPDPVAGLREVRRVVAPGGRVAACVWDHAGRSGPLALFWRVARRLRPDTPDEGGVPGARRGHLAELADAAGLRVVEDTRLEVVATYPSFDAWWRPFTAGVGPAGDHVARLDDRARTELREELRAEWAAACGPGALEVHAAAWAVLATA